MQYTALMSKIESFDKNFARLVGARVKTSRVAANLTLDELAERSGVSRRTIVSIEQGATNASIAVLLRISTSLGVGLASLVTDRKTDSLGVLRASAHKTSWVGTSGGAASLVASTDNPEIFELWDWVLGPWDNYVSEAHSEGTHELIHVITGTVNLMVDGVEQVLTEGDSASYAGTKPHSYSNSSDSTARFSLAVLQPNVRRNDGR